MNGARVHLLTDEQLREHASAAAREAVRAMLDEFTTREGKPFYKCAVFLIARSLERAATGRAA